MKSPRRCGGKILEKEMKAIKNFKLKIVEQSEIRLWRKN